MSLPTEFGVGQGWVGGEIQDIAITARSNLVRKVTTNGMTEGLDHVKNSRALAGSQIPGLDTRLLLTKIVESDQVTLGKIQNMDVVTDGCTVLGFIV